MNLEDLSASTGSSFFCWVCSTASFCAFDLFLFGLLGLQFFRGRPILVEHVNEYPKNEHEPDNRIYIKFLFFHYNFLRPVRLLKV